MMSVHIGMSTMSCSGGAHGVNVQTVKTALLSDLETAFDDAARGEVSSVDDDQVQEHASDQFGTQQDPPPQDQVPLRGGPCSAAKRNP